MYLLDTSVWSFVLSRKVIREERITLLVSNIIQNDLAVLCGCVRQELLSGISKKEVFIRLRDSLREFDDIALSKEDYELAAEFMNTCRAKGIQGSSTDFLLCAICANNNLTLVTSGKDFIRICKHCNFKLKFVELPVR